MITPAIEGPKSSPPRATPSPRLASHTTANGTNWQTGGLSILANPDPNVHYQPDPSSANYNPATDHYTGCDTLKGFSFPNCNTNTAFGKPTKARDPRELQLALKLSF